LTWKHGNRTLKFIRKTLAAVRSWLLAIVAPRAAALEAVVASARLSREVERLDVDWEADRQFWNRKQDSQAGIIASLEDQLREVVASRDQLSAENEVLRHQVETMIHWREVEIQRLKTEAAIHAMRRGRPIDDHEPLLPDS
jgi:hypothetical protein